MELLLYGAVWCPDTKIAEQYLKEKYISYAFVSIENIDKATVEQLIKANGGQDWAAPTFYKDNRFFACPIMTKDTFQDFLTFYNITG